MQQFPYNIDLMNWRIYINPLLIITTIAVTFLSSCFSVEGFSKEELLFAKPFLNPHQLIFQSPTGQRDTIAFSAMSIDTIKYRSIEQGFYNELALSVNYRLSPGSYHKETIKSVNDEPEHFLQFTRAKGSHSSKQVSFLGLIFNEGYLNRIAGERKGVLNFRKEEAVYSGVNINEGIKSFLFSFDKGIISFIDKQGDEWKTSD